MSRLRIRAGSILVPGVAVFLVLVPSFAEACAVCGAGRDEASRLAFIVTTAFMSALPLVLIGSLVFWLRSRFRTLAEEDRALRSTPEAGEKG